MVKKRVLFVCIHNSARSQMAEAFLTELCGDTFEAQSAGLEPGTLNPLAVAAMAEIGVDISGKETTGVFDLVEAGETYSYVVTVCDETAAERCPVFPGRAQRLHWSFPDPGALEGTWEERLARTREIRDAIRDRIRSWCEEVCSTPGVARPA